MENFVAHAVGFVVIFLVGDDVATYDEEELLARFVLAKNDFTSLEGEAAVRIGEIDPIDAFQILLVGERFGGQGGTG